MSELSPVKHFIVVMRAVLVRGAGLPEIQTPLLVVTLPGVVALAFAVRPYPKTTA